MSRVTAALQRQATRDFGPIWEVHATVDAFPRLEDVPVGYWPMIVETDINTPGAAGVHLDKDGQPFALIAMSDSWSLTASHEMLEMLADPFGNRVIAGKSPKRGQGRVEFLVEVCDPSEADGVRLHGQRHPGLRLLHAALLRPADRRGRPLQLHGRDQGPREILRGGYISWHDPVSDHWWQQVWFGQRKQYRDLGVFDASAGTSLRSWVDGQTEHPGIDQGLKKTNAVLKSAVAAGKETADGGGQQGRGLARAGEDAHLGHGRRRQGGPGEGQPPLLSVPGGARRSLV